jgi:hypothetical protein
MLLVVICLLANYCCSCCYCLATAAAISRNDHQTHRQQEQLKSVNQMNVNQMGRAAVAAAAAAKCDQRCHTYINNKRTHLAGEVEPTLFTAFNYKISYGLPVYKSESTAIGYSIDVECYLAPRKEQHTSHSLIQSGAIGSKLRMHYSFDISQTPIEINMINCGATMTRVEALIKNLTLTTKTTSGINEPKYEYLNMSLRLRQLRNKSLDMSIRLSLNRRLGDGCMTNLTLKKLPFDPKYLNDQNEENENEDENDSSLDNLSTYAIYQKLVKVTLNKLLRSFEANVAHILILSTLVVSSTLAAVCCAQACLRKMRCMRSAATGAVVKKAAASPEPPHTVSSPTNASPNLLLRSVCTPNSMHAREEPLSSTCPTLPASRLPAASNEFQLLRQQLIHRIEEHNNHDHNNIRNAARPSLKNLIF